MIIRSPCNKAKRTVDRGREREGGREIHFSDFKSHFFPPFFLFMIMMFLGVLLSFNPSAICVERV